MPRTSTKRTDGRPSGEAVASAAPSARPTPAATASASHSRARWRGSATARSVRQPQERGRGRRKRSGWSQTSRLRAALPPRGAADLIEGWSASADVFTRAVPLLALVFVGELLGAIDLDWSLWTNLAAGLGGLAFLVAGFGLANVLRGRPLRGAAPQRRPRSSWRCS